VAQNVLHQSDQTIQHFNDHGWMRIPRAFSEDAAAAMREAVWRALADAGVHRDRPSTWSVARPNHLQRLKNDPVFRAVGSATVYAAIDTIFDGRPYDAPKDWGAVFVTFPTGPDWGVPTKGWHIDANLTSSLSPVRGVKTHALFGDVAPRGGGTLILGGSHRLVHQWFQKAPPPAGARSADLRKLLRSHPYIRDLNAGGDPDERVARFMGQTEDMCGVPLRVVENVGAAGDVLILHPLVLHVAAPNALAEPRFLLSGGITTDQWGWDVTTGLG
jgi:hypothetical protein